MVLDPSNSNLEQLTLKGLMRDTEALHGSMLCVVPGSLGTSPG